jgi:hypothetical protein
MKFSFSKLVFETFYMLTILIVGVGSGLLVSKMGVYYLVSKAGFIDGLLNSTMMNSDGYYEIVPPNPSDLR